MKFCEGCRLPLRPVNECICDEDEQDGSDADEAPETQKCPAGSIQGRRGICVRLEAFCGQVGDAVRDELLRHVESYADALDRVLDAVACAD